MQERSEVRLAIARQRRRDAHEDRLRLMQLDEAVGERAALEHRADALRRDVLDVRATLAQRGDLALVDVDADDVEPALGEADRQRQSDVAESDDSDAHRAPKGFNAVRRTPPTVAAGCLGAPELGPPAWAREGLDGDRFDAAGRERV